jgi:hypothetical protein
MKNQSKIEKNLQKSINQFNQLKIFLSKWIFIKFHIFVKIDKIHKFLTFCILQPIRNTTRFFREKNTLKI